MTGPHLVDIVGLHSRLDLQVIRIRNHFHDRIAGANHAADGVGGKLMDQPRCRRPDVDAIQKIARRYAALHQFGFLAPRLTKLLHDV